MVDDIQVHGALVSLDSFRDSIAQRTSVWILETELDFLGCIQLHHWPSIAVNLLRASHSNSLASLSSPSHRGQLLTRCLIRMIKWVNLVKPLEQCVVHSKCF